MFRPKAGSLAPRPSAARAFLALVLAATLLGALCAQPPKTIIVLVLDGKTGQPVVPSNLVVRIDHLDAVHNDWLQLNDDGTGKVSAPAGASFLSIQATYDSSGTLHWYSIADILKSGVAMPNECYKAKYAEATRVTPKPGQFVLFVRKTNWRELPD
jgi:hypothetical protein